MSATVFTIGHSNHSAEEFLRLLGQHGIQAVADVRSQPHSRFVPHFNQEAIGAFLQRNGMEYVFLGRELGARREEQTCYADGRAEYDRIAELPLFREGIQRICRGTMRYRIALMCSEKDPLFCHRCVLVGRVLAVAGIAVRHIHGDGHLESQEEVEERMIRILSLQPDLFAGGTQHSELVARAYREQGRRIAVREDLGGYETLHDRVHKEVG